MNKKIVQTGLEREIYRSAKEYHDSTKVMDKMKHTLPYITNLGFAIELYIKCMNVTTETLPNNPASKNLVSSVSIPAGGGVVIDRIGNMKIHTRLKKDTHSLIKMFQKHEEPLKLNAINEYRECFKSDLIVDLETVGSPFSYWRYHFENEHSHTGFALLEKLADFFEMFANKQNMKITLVPVEAE
ncbi:hypothetical protein [Agarivorans gilvus]|uniref:Uncharacterized protein n=1 Tax=Agarivorans gilvus TaxID=680279 RepID=A0ABQ1I5A7_9ALTE|nr:hypothetical protein [Agarivorans gilvus]GGB18244.1 hypothetical protein GCM10007414_34580 [Agarivorans gilvus]